MASSSSIPDPGDYAKSSAMPTSESMAPRADGDMTGSTDAPGDTPSSLPGRPEGEMFDRVVLGAHETIDRLAEKAAPTIQRLQKTVSSAGDVLHSRAEQAREIGDEWAESLRCSVRERPLLAVATALMAGALIARLARR